MLGQIIGTIGFMKSGFESSLNQFKLSNMLIFFKEFSCQFNLVRILLFKFG